MVLYEATNGYVGESYIRCYVWAMDETEALTMAREKFQLSKSHHRMGAKIILRQLMNVMVVENTNGENSFCTEISDCGWDVKE